ncbi:MAG: hypothetical protein OXD44_00030 [Gammaproteobacteria bacterium]|nr:hypothetical protein [Gammaproteobacteria bacterium]
MTIRPGDILVPERDEISEQTILVGRCGECGEDIRAIDPFEHEE